MKYTVNKINISEAKEWFLKKHYAKRIPPASYIFGLFDGLKLVGVCSFGVPASSPLRAGICGEKYICRVIELNRLVTNELEKNALSFFVSRAIKNLPKPKIIVSYADTGQGHNGYIYQALNFIYTGLSAKRTDWKIKGMEGLHGATIADMSRGKENRAEYMREKFGTDFYSEERSRKHRYIFFHGSRTDKKNMKHDLKYEVVPYPKEKSVKYDAGFSPVIQLRFF